MAQSEKAKASLRKWLFSRAGNDEMWSMWVGDCMHPGCREREEVWITMQRTHLDRPVKKALCLDCSFEAVEVLAGHSYYLQVEPSGLYQGELPIY